ncbi:MAG: MAPEG family protein [bacterium]
MMFPLWMLLSFAVWTVLVLLFSVGIYRWSNILTGRIPIREFRGDKVEGSDFYLRGMRAHANCVENLPVFAAIVLVIYASGIQSQAVDLMCGIIVAARVFQSLVHLAVPQTNGVVLVRFVFFFAQPICFLGIALIVARTFL